MIKRIISTAILPLYCGLLFGCGGQDKQNTLVQNPQEGDRVCQLITQRTYFATDLDEGGNAPGGVWLMHWYANFDGDFVRFRQSDVGIANRYSCQDGVVEFVANNGQTDELVTIDFTQNDTEFSYNPFGGEAKHYVAQGSSGVNRDCSGLSGKRYQAVSVTTDALSDPIPTEMPFVEFGERQQVEYDIYGSGQAPVEGFYDCDMGEIHLHADANDVEPAIVTLTEEDDRTISIRDGEYQISMQQTGDLACPGEPQKVCAVEPQNIQCFAAPCPVGLHKTILQSACEEELPLPYKMVHRGECGELEGQPYYQEEDECNLDETVCAQVLTKDPCETIPCPARVHKTFSNECDALSANATVLFNEACGDFEGKRVTQLPFSCLEPSGNPVCAKTTSSIQCIANPCPNYTYRTFVSRCSADDSLASVSFDGECGDLESVLTFGHPPAKMVTNLPDVEKRVSISNPSFNEEILTVELGYSGCSPQHFDLYFSSEFAESQPVQARFVFQPMVEDGCLAVFSTQLSYDLLPLKQAYQKAYNTQSGEIELPGIGTFVF